MTTWSCSIAAATNAVDITDADAVRTWIARPRPRRRLPPRGPEPRRGVVERRRGGATGQRRRHRQRARRRAAAGVAPHLVIGSAEEYGRIDPPRVPVRENAAQHPVSPYARSKVAAEALALAAAARRADRRDLRPRVQPHRARAIGPTSSSRASRRAWREAERAGSTPTTSPSATSTPVRDYTDVRDVVRAVPPAREQRRVAGQVYNVCSGYGVSRRRLAPRLLALARRPLRLAVDPGPRAARRRPGPRRRPAPASRRHRVGAGDPARAHAPRRARRRARSAHLTVEPAEQGGDRPRVVAQSVARALHQPELGERLARRRRRAHGRPTPARRVVDPVEHEQRAPVEPPGGRDRVDARDLAHPARRGRRGSPECGSCPSRGRGPACARGRAPSRAACSARRWWRRRCTSGSSAASHTANVPPCPNPASHTASHVVALVEQRSPRHADRRAIPRRRSRPPRCRCRGS